MANTKKLLAISLMARNKVKCLSAYDGEVLVISEMESIAGIFGSWRTPLKESIKTYLDNDFTVLIEERTDHFAIKGTSKVLLDEIDPQERRSYLNIALDHYFGLTMMGESSSSQLGNIVFNQSLQRHAIRESLINVLPDERGRNRYEIDQDQFTGYHRALLLSVLGAVVFNPMSQRYLSQLLQCLNVSENTPHDHLATIKRVAEIEKYSAIDQVDLP